MLLALFLFASASSRRRRRHHGKLNLALEDDIIDGLWVADDDQSKSELDIGRRFQAHMDSQFSPKNLEATLRSLVKSSIGGHSRSGASFRDNFRAAASRHARRAH